MMLTLNLPLMFTCELNAYNPASLMDPSLTNQVVGHTMATEAQNDLFSFGEIRVRNVQMLNVHHEAIYLLKFYIVANV